MASVIAKTHQLLISRFGKINRLMGQVIERELTPLGITYQEMRIAGLLMGEECLTQKALAEKLSVRAATLSVAISKLEAQGLVKRVPSQSDKRVNFLHLVPSKKITKVDDVLMSVEGGLVQGISKADLNITAQVLTKIIENLDSQKETQL